MMLFHMAALSILAGFPVSEIPAVQAICQNPQHSGGGIEVSECRMHPGNLFPPPFRLIF